MSIDKPIDGRLLLSAVATLLLLLFAATAGYYGFLEDRPTSATFHYLASAVLYHWTLK